MSVNRSFYWSVHHFSPGRNISITSGWIAGEIFSPPPAVRFTYFVRHLNIYESEQNVFIHTFVVPRRHILPTAVPLTFPPFPPRRSLLWIYLKCLNNHWIHHHLTLTFRSHYTTLSQAQPRSCKAWMWTLSICNYRVSLKIYTNINLIIILLHVIIAAYVSFTAQCCCLVLVLHATHKISFPCQLLG